MCASVAVAYQVLIGVVSLFLQNAGPIAVRLFVVAHYVVLGMLGSPYSIDDNILSIMVNRSHLVIYVNIVASAVVFNVGTEGSRLTVSVRNSCKKDIGNAESTGIGLVNIRNMMEKMGGSSMTQVEDGFFTVKLFFENVS